MATSTPDTAVLLLAGGSGSRFGASRNKVYLPLAGRSVLSWSLSTFAGLADVAALVLVARPEDTAFVTTMLTSEVPGLDVEVVAGGQNRQASEFAGLTHLADRITSGRIGTVLIHDGARPLVSSELAAAVIEGAREHGGAVPGVPVGGLARVDADRLTDLVAGELVAVQTPQGFAASAVLQAYRRAAIDGYAGTDTASCVRHYTDVAVRWIPGAESNLKITYPHDLTVAEALLRGRHTEVSPER
jgi:2-C-methyl-D-erythritol 4-phosphate cytidylyltransferase